MSAPLKRVQTLAALRGPGDYMVVGPGHLVLVCPVCTKADGPINGIEIHPAHCSLEVVSFVPLTLEPLVRCPWSNCLFMVSNDQAFEGSQINVA
jgi:hypothetical protein